MQSRTLPLVGALLLLSGCGDGKGGTQADVRSECSGIPNGEACRVTLVSLEGGAYRHPFRDEDWHSMVNAVQVTARITTGTGKLRVWWEDPQGQRVSAAVEAGRPTELQGTAQVAGASDDRSFSVYFQPEGETKRVENVQAEIRYTTR